MSNHTSNTSQPIELPEPIETGDLPPTPISEDGKGNVKFGHVNAPQAPVSQQAQPNPSSVNDQSLIADDIDLIEKEWVTKAKAIVAQTTSDPSLRAQEIGKMKAEYIKKRYNKDIKTDGAK